MRLPYRILETAIFRTIFRGPASGQSEREAGGKSHLVAHFPTPPLPGPFHLPGAFAVKYSETATGAGASVVFDSQDRGGTGSSRHVRAWRSLPRRSFLTLDTSHLSAESRLPLIPSPRSA